LLAEQAIREGLVVVVAAGNSGCSEQHRPVPPANSPGVITVGGYDDKNLLNNKHLDLYCSSFGPTADGIIKPEIIAPAIWVAAPILPNTPAYRKAETLSRIAAAPDFLLNSLVKNLAKIAELPEELHREMPRTIRKRIDAMLKENKIVATHYQHVEGTSFAAPVVASVVAQMLEANPSLNPIAVKQILIATATRIANAPLLRQGYGSLNASEAVKQAASERHSAEWESICPPRIEGEKLIFFLHHDSAKKVSLAGDFNRWNPHPAERLNSDGLWRGELSAPPAGRYRYKFIVDEKVWTDDPANPVKELDEFGGFNSILVVHEN